MGLMKWPLAIVLFPVLIGCGEPSSQSALSAMVGKEVEVLLAPTILTTATSTEVRKNDFSGKLVRADNQWVVLDAGRGQIAINRTRVISIVEK